MGFVNLVIGLGIALRGGLTQQNKRLRPLRDRHVACRRNLELRILRESGERHLATEAMQFPAATQHFIADILLWIFGKPQAGIAGIGWRQRRFAWLHALSLRHVARQRRQKQRTDNGDSAKQNRPSGDPERPRRSTTSCRNFRGRNHFLCQLAAQSPRTAFVAAAAGLVQIRAWNLTPDRREAAQTGDDGIEIIAPSRN
jgi:hypothetical protein